MFEYHSRVSSTITQRHQTWLFILLAILHVAVATDCPNTTMKCCDEALQGCIPTTNNCSVFIFCVEGRVVIDSVNNANISITTSVPRRVQIINTDNLSVLINSTNFATTTIDITNSSNVVLGGDIHQVNCSVVGSANINLNFQSITTNGAENVSTYIDGSTEVNVTVLKYTKVTTIVKNCTDVQLLPTSCTFVTIIATHLNSSIDRQLVFCYSNGYCEYTIEVSHSTFYSSSLLTLGTNANATVVLTSVTGLGVRSLVNANTVKVKLFDTTLQLSQRQVFLIVGVCNFLGIYNSSVFGTLQTPLSSFSTYGIKELRFDNVRVLNCQIANVDTAILNNCAVTLVGPLFSIKDSASISITDSSIKVSTLSSSIGVSAISLHVLRSTVSVTTGMTLAIENRLNIVSSTLVSAKPLYFFRSAVTPQTIQLSIQSSWTFNCSLIGVLQPFPSNVAANITLLLRTSSLMLSAPLIAVSIPGTVSLTLDHVDTSTTAVFNPDSPTTTLVLRSAKLPTAYLPESATTLFEDCYSVVRSPYTEQPVAVKGRLMIDQVRNNSNQKIVFNDSVCMLTRSATTASVPSVQLSSESTFSRTSETVTPSLPVPLVAPTDAPLPAQIGSNVAAAASLVTGSDTSNIVMMSMLSLLSCEGRPSALGTTTNTVSLFFTLGGWQMAVGNLGLALAILIAHVTATSFLSWRRGTSFPTECHGVVRFPSMSITASEFLLPGSTYGAVMVLTNTDSDAGELAACIMCIVVVVGTIVVRQAFLVLSVLPHTQWELYLHRPVDVWDAKLYPIGRWSPKGMRNSFGSLIGPMKRRFASYRIVESILSLLIAAAAGAGGQSAEYVCRSLVYLVGVLCAVVALLCALTRPYRFPMDRYTTPLVHLLFSIVCFLKASNANAVIVSWIQVVQSVVLVWKNVWMVWISLREAMWEDEADANDEEDKDEGGGGIIRTIVAALWFGGGGLGTSRNNTQFTRIARTEEEELADWLPDDVLQRDVPGINIGDQLMAPFLVQGPANDEDIFQPKDTVDLMSCSSRSSEEDAPPLIHEDDVDVEGVIELRVEDKPPVVNNTVKTDFFVGIEGYYMN
ncbi:membrane-associated protein, putative [Bodo saltans]|uniref:Membrane-associated protein, putative n=1 Tax=Bodo saltans TaxID=75058 RepID=A0A0S4KML2_BODSA|nr:membrane-associated protein, putative [Bodo saltans]|eukprot:CUM57948.1 membrane-associated protein, putative [Bodo saltans]